MPLISILNSQHPDGSIQENSDVQRDAHEVNVPVDKAVDENFITFGDEVNLPMDGVNSSGESHIVQENIQIPTNDTADNDAVTIAVNPVDRNLDEEMMDMETELNNPKTLSTSKLVDYQSTSEADRE